MMNFLSRCNNVVSPVFRRSLLQQTSVFRGVCLVPTAAFHAPCLPRRSSADLWQHRHHVDCGQLGNKRFYSEICSESGKTEDTVGMNQEELHERHRDRSQRSPPVFNLDVLVSLLRQENAMDICVIKVPEQVRYVEHFIVVSGTSVRHLSAMAFYAIKVYKFMKAAGQPNVKIEGKTAEDWICIDFGKMVVHFMLPEVRELYELEKLWTLREYDEQLKRIPPETLPEDFIYDIDTTK